MTSMGTGFRGQAPAMFAGIYNNLCKPWMDPTTAAKVEIHAGVPTERLLELMPPYANSIWESRRFSVQGPS